MKCQYLMESKDWAYGCVLNNRIKHCGWWFSKCLVIIFPLLYKTAHLNISNKNILSIKINMYDVKMNIFTEN